MLNFIADNPDIRVRSSNEGKITPGDAAIATPTASPTVSGLVPNAILLKNDKGHFYFPPHGPLTKNIDAVQKAMAEDAARSVLKMFLWDITDEGTAFWSEVYKRLRGFVP